MEDAARASIRTCCVLCFLLFGHFLSKHVICLGITIYFNTIG